jgi:hypothetical protein
MKTAWQRHLTICLILGLLSIPIYILDLTFAGGGGGGNWITLNFRGFIIGTYLAWLAIQVTLTTFAIRLFPGSGPILIHFGTVIPSLVLLVGGFFAYVKLEDRVQANQSRAIAERRKPHLNIIELKDWLYFPDDINPTELRVEVLVHAAGRFAGNVSGAETDASGSSRPVFQSTNDPSRQRRIGRDETFTYAFPLEILHAGRATDVSITLYLFEPQVEPAIRDITKIFIKSPSVDDDGQYFYGTLPGPSRK